MRVGLNTLRLGRIDMTRALGLTLTTTHLSACGGHRAFTRSKYSDNEISMLDDKWNQNDMQLVAKR